jgi:hypothetical protein
MGMRAMTVPAILSCQDWRSGSQLAQKKPMKIGNADKKLVKERTNATEKAS